MWQLLQVVVVVVEMEVQALDVDFLLIICHLEFHHQSHDGRAVIACLHLVNATPFHWHTKRQATVETATFGSEFVTTRIATDQIIYLSYTLMYLGVPIRSKIYMFGDNKSVVDSASTTSTLSKKSTLAS